MEKPCTSNPLSRMQMSTSLRFSLSIQWPNKQLWYVLGSRYHQWDTCHTRAIVPYLTKSMNYKQKLGKQATTVSLLTEGFDVKLHKTENMKHAFLQRLEPLSNRHNIINVSGLFLMVMHVQRCRTMLFTHTKCLTAGMWIIYILIPVRFDFKTSDDLTKQVRTVVVMDT
jgi:hypothetical protein